MEILPILACVTLCLQISPLSVLVPSVLSAFTSSDIIITFGIKLILVKSLGWSLLSVKVIQVAYSTHEQGSREIRIYSAYSALYSSGLKNKAMYYVLQVDLQDKHGVRFISNTSFVSTAGEDAYLGCVVEDPLEDLSQISWQRSADLNFVVYRPDRGPIPVNELGKRVRFERKGQWDGSIILQNVSPSDEGTYICIFTIFPSGPFHRLVRLMVNVKPEITVFTEDPIEEGETESRIATCRAENGKPAAKISWRTPFPTLGSMESSSMHKDLTITIESQLRAIPARSMHRQEVQCVVEHLSLAQPEVVSSKLTVQYPPSVVVTKINTPTKLTFQCEADANPPVDRYDWKRENEVLPDGAAVTEAQLEFSVITPDLSGLYYCRASTPNATATGVLYLQIGISTNYMALFTLAVILLLSVIIILVFFHAKQRN